MIIGSVVPVVVVINIITITSGDDIYQHLHSATEGDDEDHRHRLLFQLPSWFFLGRDGSFVASGGCAWRVRSVRMMMTKMKTHVHGQCCARGGGDQYHRHHG